ncbi:MAG: hypothetical protein M1829_002667 [Trizodia sp. TS-e1964]|nr:MAG: hypothetical protein M1829_002667 [Trizodia sp. TS-e1964]
MAETHEQMPSFADMINSKIFHFYIGPERAHYKVHTARVAFASPVLRKHISGGMRETFEGRSFLKEVEAETFEKFVEWIYHSTFIPKNPGEAKAAGLVMAFDYQLELGDREIPGFNNSKKIALKREPEFRLKPSRLKLAWSRFLGRSFQTPPGWENISTPSFESATYEANDNLLHAKLFVFGDIYQIKALQVTAIRKIHRNLATFTPETGDLVDLVRYIYSDIDSPTSMELLQDVMTEYLSCQWGRFAKSDVFLELLEEGGPFVSEVIKKHYDIHH